MIATVLASAAATAQPKSAGAVFGFSGIAASYEHMMDKDSFSEISLKISTEDIFRGRLRTPGVQASYIWNTYADKRILKEDGTLIRLYGGPGVSAGYVSDWDCGYGILLGLTGNFGAEFQFRRNIQINIFLSPTIGIHTHKIQNGFRISLYKYGMLALATPNIAVRYAF